MQTRAGLRRCSMRARAMLWLPIPTRCCTTPRQRCCAMTLDDCRWWIARIHGEWLVIWVGPELWPRVCAVWTTSMCENRAGSRALVECEHYARDPSSAVPVQDDDGS